MFKAEELINDYGFSYIGIEDIGYEEMVTDSRQAGLRKAFVCIKGSKVDGHDFIEDAYSQGTRVFIVDSDRIPAIRRAFKNRLTSSTLLYIPEHTAYEALIMAARRKASNLKGEIIGITGSSGKTTLKEMIAQFLSGKYTVFKARKNFNTPLGISIEIMNASPLADFYIFEYGARKKGDLDELLEIISPHRVFITNIGYAHIGILGSRDEIFNEKIKLAKAPTVTEVYLNSSDDYYLKAVEELKNYTAKIFTSGRRDEDDLRFEIISLDEVGYPQVLFKFKNLKFEFKVPVPGIHNVENLAMSILLALRLQVDVEEILKIAAELKLPEMRLNIISKKGFTFINDAYNSNPASLKAALEFLFVFTRNKEVKKVAVIGDMLELGEFSERMHKEAGELARKLGVDFIIYVGEFYESFREGFGSNNLKRADSPEDAARILETVAPPGSVILLKGSRAIGLERVLENV